MNLTEKCRPVELILSDVDGVLTDGGIIYDNNGVETKRFCVRDGQGIAMWLRRGGRFGLVTARNSHVVEVRAAQLGVSLVRQGVQDKLSVVRQLMSELALSVEQTAYIGDDLPDLAALEFVGLGIAVADACTEVREAADLVTESGGGRGAVREAVETLLKTQQRWDELVKGYRLS